MKFQGKKLALVVCLVVVFMSAMLTGCGSSSSSSADSAFSTTIEETTTDSAASTPDKTNEQSGLLGSAATKSEKTDSAQAAPAGTKTYENAKYGIKFNYPQAWTMQEGSGNGLVVMFITNQTDPKKVASLNLAVEELPKGITLDDYNKTAEGQLKSAISGFKMLSTNNISVGDNKAISLEYLGEQQGVKLSCLSTFFVRDGKAFVFTFAGVEAGYASVLPDVKSLFKSVSFK